MPAQKQKQRMEKPFRASLALVFPVLLAACRIEITVPEGAAVESLSGTYRCTAEQPCTLSVDDTEFAETFTAIAPPGQRFTGWQKSHRYFCGGSIEDCELSTRGFPGTPFMAVLESDDTFYLRPTFGTVIGDEEFWTDAVRTMRDGNYRRNFPEESRLYQRLPDAENCDGGELTEWARNQALDTLNALRNLHDLPPVSYLASFDSQTQAAALVQLANDGYVGHFPQPEHDCYSQLAYDGASTSNLHYGSDENDPTVHILGWADDRNNIADLMAVGHRRHILNPELGFLNYGATHGFAAQKVFDFGRSVSPEPLPRDFVAFPFGAYPYALLSDSMAEPTPWSFHIVADSAWTPEHPYFSSAAVTIVDTVSGETVAVTDLYNDSGRGYGRLHGALSWIVPVFEYDRHYQVTVSNVSFPDGSRREFSYSVELVRAPILDLHEPLEDGDQPLAQGLRGAIENSDDRDSTELRISAGGSYQLTAQTRYSNWALYVELFDADKQLLLSTDETATIDLPPGDYTLTVGRCSDQRWCYNWDSLDYELRLQ